jgi:sodium/bile acid cotransporter 7
MALRHVLSALKKNWMLVGVVLSIAGARAAPAVGARDGPLYPDITVKYLAVALIFFLSGLGLRPRQLAGAVANVPLHALIQGFTLVAVPIFVRYVVAPVLYGAGLDRWLCEGLVAVSCLPPPVSSAVILTKAAGGNEAAAIFNSAFGSLLGVLITPIELVALVDAGGASSNTTGAGASGALLATLGRVFRQLFVTVVIPLFCGQVARPRLEAWLDRAKPPLSEIGQATLLLIIFTTFCDTFSGGESVESSRRGALAVTGLVVLSLQLVFLGAVFMLTATTKIRRRPLPPGDVICALFCASHKSLTLGIPVMKIVFPDHPRFGLLSAPLLMYHPIQIVLGGVLVPSVRAWARRHAEPAGAEIV